MARKRARNKNKKKEEKVEDSSESSESSVQDEEFTRTASWYSMYCDIVNIARKVENKELAFTLVHDAYKLLPTKIAEKITEPTTNFFV